MKGERTPRTSALAALGGIVAMVIATLVPAPAGAQVDGTCPASVDTANEGWICSMLILDTPTDAPTDAQIELWSEVLSNSGRFGVTDGIVFSDASVEDKVRTIYETQLNREPDQDGLVHWREQIQQSRTEFAAEFGVFGSGEYLSQFESPEAFVNDQYQYYLGREASRSEQAHWADRFNRGEISKDGITRAIATSREAGNVRAGILYFSYAQRGAEPAGLQHWSARAAERGLFPTVVDFARSAEIVNTLGQAGMENASGKAPGSDAEQDRRGTSRGRDHVEPSAGRDLGPAAPGRSGTRRTLGSHAVPV